MARANDLSISNEKYSLQLLHFFYVAPSFSPLDEILISPRSKTFVIVAQYDQTLQPCQQQTITHAKRNWITPQKWIAKFSAQSMISLDATSVQIRWSFDWRRRLFLRSKRNKNKPSFCDRNCLIGYGI